MQEYKIIRPLIFVTKHDLEIFDKDNNIPYRIDKSNYKDNYTRNRYRKYVLPFLKKENGNVHEKFLKFSEIINEYETLAKKLTEIEINNVYKNGIIDINEFKKVDKLIGIRIIDYILGKIYGNKLAEINDKHVELIIKLINLKKTSATMNLPNNYIVVKEYNKIYFRKKIDNIKKYDIEFNDYLELPNGMILKKIDNCDDDGNDVLRINKSDIVLPLRIRTRCDGDKMSIKNMFGTKKVSDIFINAKIPLHKREDWPIVVDSENKIIWIPKVKKSKYNRLKTDNCDIIIKCL